jgi:hypothetical protein
VFDEGRDPWIRLWHFWKYLLQDVVKLCFGLWESVSHQCGVTVSVPMLSNNMAALQNIEERTVA